MLLYDLKQPWTAYVKFEAQQKKLNCSLDKK